MALYQPKGSDAYLYPLTRDGIVLSAPQQAATVALLCDTYWLTVSCDTADGQWFSANPGSGSPTRIDRFTAAPNRILTVYRLTR